MITRLLTGVRRLTAFERLLLVLIGGTPIVVGVALILDVARETPVLAIWTLVAYYLVLAAGIGAALLLRYRSWQRDRPLPKIATLAPAELATRSVLADIPEPWAEIDSPRLEQLRVVRRMASLSRHAVSFFGMRTKAEWVREPFAYLLTDGLCDFTTLERSLTSENAHADLILANADLNVLLVLGRLVASQNLDPRDGEFAEAVLLYVAARRTTSRISRGNLMHLAERLIMTGNLEIAYPLVLELKGHGYTEKLLRADLINPFHARKLQNAEDLWLTAFNGIYLPYGLEPVTLLPTGATPYDRLLAATGAVVAEGPLVTVIMSCYRPDHSLTSAVNSMIAQTWQNWELIITDDASPDDFSAVLTSVAELDPRIRVLRSTENRGTYVRRNEAIQVARGEFVTMHDSDDWVHPRRLELQARHLMENPDDLANVCSSLRVSEDLMFVQPRGATMRLTESSLLFRKEVVTERVGYFDSVRKAADSEYRLRIEAAFGRPVPTVDTLAPLALVRYAVTSLSGSDLGDGWMHPVRVAYRSACIRWHTQIRQGKASPYVAFPLLTRPFPAHDKVIGNPVRHRDLDVLVVLDMRVESHPAGHLAGIVTELEALAQNGLSVGILHLESLIEGRPPIVYAPILQDLIVNGTVQLVLLEDDVHATTVVIRNASVLQAVPFTGSGVVADRCVIFDDAASGRDRRAHNFARADVDASVSRLFGSVPVWRGVLGVIDYGFLLTNRALESSSGSSGPLS